MDLRSLAGETLDSLLVEEAAEWGSELDWDFAQAADLIRRCVDLRALTGAAVLDRGEAVGYGYALVEDERGVIGDLYVRRPWRNGETECGLLKALIDRLRENPQVRRIESQLPLMGLAAAQALQRDPSVKAHERVLLSIDCTSHAGSTSSIARRRFRIEPWDDAYLETAARAIALAYEGHVDIEVGGEYGTPAGAERSLSSILRDTWCSACRRSPAFVAFDQSMGVVSGIVMTSFVREHTGHIAQICVVPRAQGTGLGRELLGQAIDALRASGARAVSLTVTVANDRALQWYVRYGFREVRRLFACVWEGGGAGTERATTGSGNPGRSVCPT